MQQKISQKYILRALRDKKFSHKRENFLIT